jgi:hypothetical protein
MMARCTFMRATRWPERCSREAVPGEAHCRRHLTVLRQREERRQAPHVHRAWPSRTVKTRADGTLVGFCAECGSLMFDTRLSSG